MLQSMENINRVFPEMGQYQFSSLFSRGLSVQYWFSEWFRYRLLKCNSIHRNHGTMIIIYGFQLTIL